MKKYVLVLDSGKHSLKSIGRCVEATSNDIKKVIFRTKIFNLKNEYVEVEGNSHLLEIDGEKLIIGEQGKETEDNYETTKSTDLHKYAIYTAITQYLEPNTTENEVYIVLACPLSVLSSADAKEEYKKLIKGNGIIKLIVDNMDYEFEIKDITLKQEDSGIMYLRPELFKNKEIGLIGFGGLNMNFALYNNCVCQAKFSEEMGSISLINHVREALTIYFKGNIVTYEQAEKTLNDGFLLKQGQPDFESVKYIENAKKRFFDEAMNTIKKHGYDIDTLDSVIFVGGTSLKIEPIIKKYLKHSFITPNAQWDSPEGLYRIAIKKYGNIAV